MGSETFDAWATGYSAKEAFDKAVKKAQYDYGHAGYTGTIAEKDSFVMIPYTSSDTSDSAVGRAITNLIESGDDRIDDKWGPAGCFDLGPDKKHPSKHVYVFFGWASS